MNAHTVMQILRKPKCLLEKINYRYPRLLRWMSDEQNIRFWYRYTFGREPDLENPRTFNEKLQWLKLHDRKPEYTSMVDKYEAKKYVAEKIGAEYIIPTLGVWDRFEDIDFDSLPNQFVLKCTHDSGGLVICRDKAKLDVEKARKKINRCMKRNYYWVGREWPYKDVKPRIIAEQYMEDGTGKGLVDYKLYCFHGKPLYLYISQGLEDHATAKISFLDMDWNWAPFGRSDFAPFEELPAKPVKFEEMKETAGKLSEGHSFLRVDLYQIGQKVYFSELTFCPCSGLMPFSPEEWDTRLGALIEPLHPMEHR